MSGPGDILVVNAGSSSLKVSLFDAALGERHRLAVSEIGGDARLTVDGATSAVSAPDHEAALDAVFDALSQRGIAAESLAAAGHRVVHGGTKLTRPTIVTPDVERAIEACNPLAPLHNPVNLAAIRALSRRVPGLVQTASFDTAFHATIPEVATRYALPKAETEKGLRRYGFHGTSYAALVHNLPDLSGGALPGRLLAFHLGNGASICAIRNGHSVATTMGYSPVSGLTMGTRSGEIDANAVLRLARDHGIDGAQRILNHESGLRGLAGISDMARIEGRADLSARFALGHFTYWASRHAGSLIAAMDGLDAIAFTGGIGEHSARVRGEIMERFQWLGLKVDAKANAAGAWRLDAQGSSVAAFVLRADEERQIARETAALL